MTGRNCICFNIISAGSSSDTSPSPASGVAADIVDISPPRLRLASIATYPDVVSLGSFFTKPSIKSHGGLRRFISSSRHRRNRWSGTSISTCGQRPTEWAVFTITCGSHGGAERLLPVETAEA